MEYLTTEKEATVLLKYNNEWFNPGHPVKRALWLFINTLFFNHPLALSSRWKRFLLRLFGGQVGRGVLIKPSVNIKYPWLLQIGDYCWIGENVWIDNLTNVAIGNNVCISQGAMLLTGNHDFSKPTFDLIVKGIVLEEGVWIGARAVVCPGVHAESHAILTVQSTATKNMKAYTIYQGNPALPIKKRVFK